MGKQIVIVDDEPITRMDIRELLCEAGYDVVGEASDGFEAIDVCRKYSPNLVIMDIKMPVLDGLKASKIIMHEKLADGILLLSAFNDKDYIQQACNVGAFGYLVKPLDEKSFIPTVEMALGKGRQFSKLEDEYKKVSQKLEDRKAIDIAKGLLMKEKKILESEAYHMLRKLGMDRRCTMGEIARTIMIMYE
jgi:AmiR/NasT family two-component response regulator